MSLGAAIAGLAGGYAKGVQIKSDLEDAKQQRGLRDLQKQQAELTLDREKQISDLRNQTAQAISGFQAASLDDVDAFNNHYKTLENLVVKEATLAGKDPVAAFQSMETLRRDKFAERVFAANQMLQMGNDAGFEILKPVFNQHFKDGQMLMGGTFNKAEDSYTIRYQDQEGNDKIMSLPRQQLMDNLLLKMLNPADAAKLMMRDRELAKTQEFEAGQLDKKLTFQGEEGEKDRGLRRDLSASEIRSRERIAAIESSGREDREDARLSRLTENDIRKNLPTAFGFDPKYQTAKSSEAFNRKATAAMNVWRTTNRLGGRSLSEYEVASVVNALDAGTGYTVGKREDGSIDVRNGMVDVRVGSTRAILPEAMLPKVPQKK